MFVAKCADQVAFYAPAVVESNVEEKLDFRAENRVQQESSMVRRSSMQVQFGQREFASSEKEKDPS